jgi:hypothetical protein
LNRFKYLTSRNSYRLNARQCQCKTKSCHCTANQPIVTMQQYDCNSSVRHSRKGAPSIHPSGPGRRPTKPHCRHPAHIHWLVGPTTCTSFRGGCRGPVFEQLPFLALRLIRIIQIIGSHTDFNEESRTKDSAMDEVASTP